MTSRAMSYTVMESPVGSLLLAADVEGLRQITFMRGRRAVRPDPEWRENHTPFKAAIRQLRAYFSGTLKDFTLPLAPEGTPFQLDVWKRLCEIPYGETTSYGEIARRIGHPEAARAVGLANGTNPLPIVIPCHRVIGSTGKLTGYGGGLLIKEKLLALERGQLTLL
jgi:methylated-DNA-[protein]-cysteine S-methyltransferase